MDKLIHRVSLRFCVAIVTLFFIYIQVSGQSQLKQTHKSEILISTEIPAEHIDPASIDLTELINTLINASHPGSQNLFSLLSVTSHSSLSLHKLTLLVYNISNFQDIESSLFSLKYCYCLTNGTNDLTDFTAVLLDVIGNSTSYLQELFKSSSILSVSQKNSSDCIYICVMAGKTDSDLSQLWDMSSITPLFNQTITEDRSRANITYPLLPFVWHDLPNNSELVLWPKPSTDEHRIPSRVSTVTTSKQELTATVVTTSPTITTPSSIRSRVAPSTMPTTAFVKTTPTISMTTQTTAAFMTVAVSSDLTADLTTAMVTQPIADTIATQPTTTTPALSLRTTVTMATTHPTVPTVTPLHMVPLATERTTTTYTEKPGCPWRKEFFHAGGEKEELREALEEELSWGRVTISSVKLQPCVFELCKFYSQCVCRGYSHRLAVSQRYCVDSHRWYEKHTAEVCSRVRRVTFSKNLKQKCLARMCVKM